MFGVAVAILFFATAVSRNAVCKEIQAMRTLLIVILLLALLGSAPIWPYSTGWGYYHTGGLGFILLIVLLIALTGRGRRL